MVDCGQHHSFCTAYFALKVQEKGCDNKLKCCGVKREKEFTLMKTQLIEGALVSNYFDFVIEEEDKNHDTVRKFSNTHLFLAFFLLQWQQETKSNLVVGSGRKQHKLLVKIAVLTVKNASK